MHNKSIINGIFLIIIFLTGVLNAKNNSILESDGTEYLAFAEVMPEPVGGLPAIYKLIKYPELAKNSGIQGKVFVLAFINEDGGVDDVKIVKGIGAGCDEAAMNAVKNTKFSSGKSGGKSSKIKLSLQIEFKLS